MSAPLLIMPNRSRPRRTGREMLSLHTEIIEVLAEDRPQTCRSVFYRLVSRGAVPKTEAAYHGIVLRLLTRMRRNGSIPWSWIVDGTRIKRKPDTSSSIAAALAQFQEGYRRDLWQSQSDYVQVWCEKDAITGVLMEKTWDYDVPLMSCKSFSSITFLHDAAEEITAQGKPTWCYYFGDWDPSGKDIGRVVEASLREFAPEAEIQFERMAVTEEQIETLHLPTHPTKKSDSRSKGFKGESVEVDAIPPKELRRMVRECITSHLSQGDIAANERNEQLERESLGQLLDGWRACTGEATPATPPCLTSRSRNGIRTCASGVRRRWPSPVCRCWTVCAPRSWRSRTATAPRRSSIAWCGRTRRTP